MKVIIPVSNNFEEIETVALVDILRRAQLNVTLASILDKNSKL